MKINETFGRMTRKEKQAARAERYREYAENADKRATAAFNASNEAVANIPPGQPILVGHHSEKAHRRALERSNGAMTRCVHETEKAAYYRQKAKAAENNDNIYLSDDDAIERLTAKIAELTALQEQMKGANKIVRAKNLSDIEKIEALVHLGISTHQANKMVGTQFMFPGYMLTIIMLKSMQPRNSLQKRRLWHQRRIESTPLMTSQSKSAIPRTASVSTFTASPTMRCERT